MKWFVHPGAVGHEEDCNFFGSIICYLTEAFSRRNGPMVSALVFGSRGPGASSGREHCVVILDETLNSHGASLHPGV